MKIIGIVAEYNPFHNGHLYHINKIKELFPDSLIILVISGYFSQRGDINILTKEDKVKIAIQYGVDIVVELPFIFGVQASDIFAYYSIKILNELKIEKLVFGSESNNIDYLKKWVDIQLNDSDYDLRVKEYLNKGVNYPTALAMALENEKIEIKANDLLGISYIKAIKQINNNIEPITIKRTNDYHDLASKEQIISANNIREKIKNNEEIEKYVPEGVKERIINVSNDNLFNLLKFKILTDKDLSIYLDVDEGIEYRLLKYINISNNMEEFINNIKTKRYTYNRIKRMFMHILIGLTKEDMKSANLDYIKILGFSKKGQEYLNKIKKEIEISTSPIANSLILNYELKSAYLYEQAIKKSLNSYDIKNIPYIKE